MRSSPRSGAPDLGGRRHGGVARGLDKDVGSQIGCQVLVRQGHGVTAGMVGMLGLIPACLTSSSC